MTASMLILACCLDALLGDPRWFPHPVRLMGRAIVWYEKWTRPLARGPVSEYMAGVILAVGLPAVFSSAAWGLVIMARKVDPLLETAVGALLAWTTLATRDLADHTLVVQRALEEGAPGRARDAVGQIVGRDTAHLSEEEIVRATTETIAESTSDGVVAPLFYLTLGGPPLAIAYKAVSTLDSMVGYRDDRYRRFGWASARLDDLANWLPARVTAWLFVVAAGLVARRVRPMRQACTVLLRDGDKHPSPNSGRPEAAMAGALEIQLGGTNFYHGVAETRPSLGDPGRPLRPAVIRQALLTMWTTVVAAVGLSLGWLLW